MYLWTYFTIGFFFFFLFTFNRKFCFYRLTHFKKKNTDENLEGKYYCHRQLFYQNELIFTTLIEKKNSERTKIEITNQVWKNKTQGYRIV